MEGRFYSNLHPIESFENLLDFLCNLKVMACLRESHETVSKTETPKQKK